MHFQKGQRKDEVAAGYRRKFTEEESVVFIGIAQEKMTSWKARKETQGKVVRFQFSQQPVFVGQYCFYLQDREFGPAFIKIGAYAPYPIKVYVNGHE